MFCSHCGTNVPDGSGFCPNCGTPVGQQAAPQAQPAQPYQQPAYQPEQQYQQPAYQQPEQQYQQPAYDPNYGYQQPAYGAAPVKKKTNPLPFIIGGIVLALGIAAILIFVVFGGGSSKSPVGEWKIKTMNGMSVREALEEELKASGMTLDQAAAMIGLDLDKLDEIITFKLEEGGKFTAVMSVMGMGRNQEGTWELKDDGKLVLTIDGDPMEFEFTGSELKGEFDDQTIVMVRK